VLPKLRTPPGKRGRTGSRAASSLLSSRNGSKKFLYKVDSCGAVDVLAGADAVAAVKSTVSTPDRRATAAGGTLLQVEAGGVEGRRDGVCLASALACTALSLLATPVCGAGRENGVLVLLFSAVSLSRAVIITACLVTGLGASGLLRSCDGG
jgi:hypothetical protein